MLDRHRPVMGPAAACAFRSTGCISSRVLNDKAVTNTMKLVFLHGPPAVGKLTVAVELARLTGFRLFHNHLTVDLVGSLFPFGSEPFVLLREQIWLATFHEAARQKLSLIFTFAPEKTVNESFIQDTEDVVRAAGGEVVFIELTCSEDALEARIEAPSRSDFEKLQSVELYRDLKESGAFTFPPIASALTLDTTYTLPAQTARRIADYLSGIH